MRATHFSDAAWRDYVYWQAHDKQVVKKINSLIEATRRNPFEGIGKPEPLKGNLSGSWSRRIDGTNRLVYQVSDEAIIVVSCRYHY